MGDRTGAAGGGGVETMAARFAACSQCTLASSKACLRPWWASGTEIHDRCCGGGRAGILVQPAGRSMLSALGIAGRVCWCCWQCWCRYCCCYWCRDWSGCGSSCQGWLTACIDWQRGSGVLVSSSRPTPRWYVQGNAREIGNGGGCARRPHRALPGWGAWHTPNECRNWSGPHPNSSVTSTIPSRASAVVGVVTSRSGGDQTVGQAMCILMLRARQSRKNAGTGISTSGRFSSTIWGAGASSWALQQRATYPFY